MGAIAALVLSLLVTFVLVGAIAASARERDSRRSSISRGDQQGIHRHAA